MQKIVVACLLMLFAACTSDNNAVIGDDVLVPVTVRVNGYAVSQDDMPGTRATSAGSYDAVKVLTLAFFKSDGTEQCRLTQVKGDNTTYTTFGDFTVNLPLGSYTMVVIGRDNFDGDVLALTSPTEAEYTSERVRETFSATKDFTVSDNEGVNLSMTLNRVVAKVVVVSTDARTANVQNIRTTFSAGGKGFNPTSGLATANTGFSNVVKGAGTTGNTTTATNFLFLASDEQKVNITVETLDADGNTITSTVVPDVPLKRNRVTTLTGKMYSADATSTFTLNADWIDGNSVNF